jgi:hypothetical protein
MAKFEYEKVNLNYIPREGDDIGLLDELGQEGWELVGITANNVAYLKRQVGSAQVGSAKNPRPRPPATSPDTTTSQR